MKFAAAKQIVKNNGGFLVVDFIFAITVAASLIILMAALTTTLSMLEVAQYVAFSTGRAHAMAADTKDRQVTLAQDQFKSYTSDKKAHPGIATMLTNGWYEVTGPLELKGGATGKANDGVFSEYVVPVEQVMPREGARFTFSAKVLKLNLPLVGKVTDPNPNPEPFSTYVTGFLIREPTSEECRTQLDKNRANALIGLDSGRFGRLLSNNGVANDMSPAYFAMEDNGC